MNFDPSDVQDVCIALGPTVAPMPATVAPASPLDGRWLLCAICMNESSMGRDCGPRYEPAFDEGGTFYKASAQQQALVAKFGRAAACSYGPMQIMFCNAPEGATPADFDDLETGMRYGVEFLNAQLERWKPQTFEAIGQIWNSGEPRKSPGPGVIAYCALLQKYYVAAWKANS